MSKFKLAGAFSLGLIVAPAGAQPPPSSTPPDAVVPVDAAPRWVRPPNIAEMLAVFPPEAMIKHVKGSATIGCKVALAGTLYDCTVVTESPPGAGFGQALLRLAPVIRMSPATHGGVPYEGASVQVPFRFSAP